MVVQEKEKKNLPKGWETVAIGEIAEVIGGGTPSSKVDKYWGGSIPWLTPKDLSGYDFRRVKSGKRNITDSGLANSSARLLPKNTVLVTSRAPIGYVALADNAIATNQGFKSLILNDEYDPDFFYYLIKHNVPTLEAVSSGTTFKEISGKAFRQIKFNVPPLPEQKAIAHILGSLDDKIELNRRMNETLEAMAQALFKSWFVDFNPVIDNALAAGNAIPDELKEKAAIRQGLDDKRKSLPDDIRRLFPTEFAYTEEMGWIPKGWKVGLFGEYVSVKRGGSPRPIQNFLAPEGFPWVKISDATSCTSRFLKKTKQFIKPEGLNKTIQLEPGTLILSNSATPGIPIFLDLQACIHDGWLYFPEKTHFNDAYLYQLFLVIKEQLLMQGNGSVFTNLKTDILRNQKIIIPQKKTIQKFVQISKQWIQKIYSLNAEVQNISNIRDTLLSKLLTGEIRMQKTEKIFEEVK